jgi:hypothetical protein
LPDPCHDGVFELSQLAGHTTTIVGDPGSTALRRDKKDARR